MNPFTLRPATAADTDAVLALSYAIYGDEDYIPATWESWLAEPNGAVTVAVSDGAVVGVIHFIMLTADDAWLEGVRVAPTFRQRGVGTALAQEVIAQARSHGAQVLRGSTEEANIAMRGIFTGSGFTQAGSYVRFTAPTEGAAPDPATEPLIHQPGPDALDGLWAWLERSNIAPLAGGCYMDGWRAVSLTDAALADFLHAGQVWTLTDYDEIQALMIAGPRERAGEMRFTIRYLDGAMQGIGQLALHLRALAATSGYGIIEARPPELLILYDALNGAGFTNLDMPLQWIYAKGIGQG
jgi:GNAT superfamily N-acetyltransferase